MTKSTITRERAQQIFLGNGPEPSASEERELARMALAAMDSEPVFTLEVARADYKGQKLGNHFGFITLDAARELKEGNYQLYTAQPAPEKYNIGEATMCHIFTATGMTDVSDMQAVFDRIEAVLAELLDKLRIAERDRDKNGWYVHEYSRLEREIESATQTAPVVPDDVLAAIQKVARIRLDLNDFDGDRRGIADCLCDAEEALIEVVNRRASMLSGGKS